MISINDISAEIFVKPKTGRRRIRDQNATTSLVDQLPRLYAVSTYDDKPRNYLTDHTIRQYITKVAVQEQLEKSVLYRDYDADERQALVDWIVTRALKVFTITLQCKSDYDFVHDAMLVFSEADFEDKDLPIDDPQLYPDRDVLRVASAFPSDLWGNWTYWKFYEEQWTCLAPVFSSTKYTYNEFAQCIFPFKIESDRPRVGAFGSVTKVRIHDDHHISPGSRVVAIKEIRVTRGNDKSGTDVAWDREATALAKINILNHHHIIRCDAAIRRGDSRYFMFPWAEGGSLRDRWESMPKQDPSAELITWALHQIRGLADALDTLHQCNSSQDGQNGLHDDENNTQIPEVQLYDEHGKPKHVVMEDTRSIRHGDLKPENILVFMDGSSERGTMKIADMGLAKQHIEKTGDRRFQTSTRYGTIQYEPPEAVETENGGRSRLYDVWSMGCIVLEFVIWILHGNDQLVNFHDQVKGDGKQIGPYFEKQSKDALRREVHHVVRRWINQMLQFDPECSKDSAIKDLLRLVREKLLVVPLPPGRESDFNGKPRLVPPGIDEDVTRYRATATEFREAMDEIISKTHCPEYLHVGGERASIKLLLSRGSSTGAGLAPHTERLSSPLALGTGDAAPLSDHGALSELARRDYTLPPLKDWVYTRDDPFAEKVLSQIKSHQQPSRPSQLCHRCSNLNFWEAGFSISDTRSNLSQNAKDCQLCKLLMTAISNANTKEEENIVVDKRQSHLFLPGYPTPVLSLVRSTKSRSLVDCQLGFPILLPPGSTEFYGILKMWLEVCNNTSVTNDNHKDCYVKLRERLPTRLIDVGTLDTPILRLVPTGNNAITSEEYIALSHPWGDPTTYTTFRTLNSNKQSFEEAIPYQELPATFRDAVDCTRHLGIRYLWIDSICIVQGDDGDFHEEAKHMESVFSGAYCVLAASRATNQLSGFLNSRPKRNFVTIDHAAEGPFYVCEAIDNFNDDVIQGSLNKRGWVLQERVLARRTIYFTKTQTYFECGAGIRCETMTTMHNPMAEFLGDPKFPHKTLRNRGSKIACFQGLYEQYSRLGFSRPEDRPIAIAGLEKRLQRAFGTKGTYGIFDDGELKEDGLFGRSLLWRRSTVTGGAGSFARIDFRATGLARVPSWSWMAYQGGIEYTNPPFNSACWEREELKAPWTRSGSHIADSAPEQNEIALQVMVRDLDVGAAQEDEFELTYDTKRTADSNERHAQCVVVAKPQNGTSIGEGRYYVLLVRSMHRMAGRGERFYERVGAGYLLGKYIRLDGSGVAAKIV
ncbi:hypothetical protein IAQ61_000697 [Plenodomus lingam]|nr:hypothetical protein IAQ61_000697 [Plenodomus lingam]